MFFFLFINKVKKSKCYPRQRKKTFNFALRYYVHSPKMMSMKVIQPIRKCHASQMLRACVIALFALCICVSASAQRYDFSKQRLSYPYYLSVPVADGNYRVTVVVGSKKHAGETCLRAENRRLMEQKVLTRKGEMKTCSFLVNKRSVNIPAYEFGGKQKAASTVKIKPGEVGSFSWDRGQWWQSLHSEHHH